MGSLPEDMILNSDQMIEERSHEWLPVLDRILPGMINSGDIFTIDDLKALRSTCKLLNKFVAPALTKLEIHFAKIHKADYEAMAASSLLENITDLKIFGYPTLPGIDEYYYEVEEFWQLHKVPVLSILKQCAPRLKRLQLSSPWEFKLPVYLLCEGYAFPNVQSFYSYPFGSLPLLQASLFSMTSLESFIVPYGISSQDPDGLLDAEDLRILSQAPFFESLTELELDINVDVDEINGLMRSLLEKATKLKKFSLGNDSSLEIFQIPHERYENIEDLTLYACVSYDVLSSLPHSLRHLCLADCRFHSVDILPATGNLPKLKSLTMKSISTDDVNWPDIISRLNFPQLTSLYFENCENSTSNDAFLIAQAGPTLPMLKEYTFEVGVLSSFMLPDGEILNVDPRLVREFCTSNLAATLEFLKLSMNFSDDGLKEIMENASSLKNIKFLDIGIGSREEMEIVAEAGAQGGWPLLDVLTLSMREEPGKDYKYWLSVCKELFAPLWPNMKVILPFINE